MQKYLHQQEYLKQMWIHEYQTRYKESHKPPGDLQYKDVLEMSNSLAKIQKRREQLQNSQIFKQQLQKYSKHINDQSKNIVDHYVPEVVADSRIVFLDIQPRDNSFADFLIAFDDTTKTIQQNQSIIKKLDKYDDLFQEKKLFADSINFGQKVIVQKEEVKRMGSAEEFKKRREALLKKQENKEQIAQKPQRSPIRVRSKEFINQVVNQTVQKQLHIDKNQIQKSQQLDKTMNSTITQIRRVKSQKAYSSKTQFKNQVEANLARLNKNYEKEEKEEEFNCVVRRSFPVFSVKK